MPRPRKEQAQDTREVALAVTRTLLHELGYQGVSMDAVAAASGVRKATLYYHFPQGKAELVLEIADRAIARDAQGIAEAIAAHSKTRSRLIAIATFLFAESVQTGTVLRDAMRFMESGHQERVYSAFHQHHYTQIRGVWETGVSAGELRAHDTERSAWAFLDLVSEMGGGGELPRDAALAAWIVDLMIDGLGA